MRQVGAQFGKSAEWVRLQLNAYEALTGERIARKPRGKRGPRPTIPRTPWQCPDCGQRRDLTATQALRAPKRCRPCAIAHVCLPSHIVERWIEARTEGQLALDRLCRWPLDTNDLPRNLSIPSEK